MSSEHIFKKGDGPYRDYGCSSLRFGKMEQFQESYNNFSTFSRLVDTKTS